MTVSGSRSPLPVSSQLPSRTDISVFGMSQVHLERKGLGWGWSPHPRAPWTGPNRGASISEGTAQGSLRPECRGVSSGAPPTPPMAEEGGPTPKCKKHRRRGGSQAARGSAGGLAAFSFENRDTIRRFDHFYFCFYASILAVLSRELGGGGRNTFFSTIFNLLLFIKLSSSFGGLKRTWTESGKTNSSETRRGLSLASWLLAALWELRVRGGGPPSSAMGGMGGAPLETPRHSGRRGP